MRIIISLIFAAVAIVGFLTWTLPEYREIESLRGQESGFGDVLASVERLKKQSGAVLSEYNSIAQGDIDRLNKFLPSQVESIKVVIELEKITKNRRLLLKSINVRSPEKTQKTSFGAGKNNKKNFEEIEIDMSVVGSYGSFIALLGDLEKSLRLIDVKKINFTAGDTDSYEFRIRAVTYWTK